MKTLIKSSPTSTSERTLDVLFDKLSSHGNKSAIVSFGKDGSQKLTFRELSKMVEDLSNGLSKTGLKKQDTVILLAANSAELIIAALSVIRAGGICVPVDMQSSDEVLKHIVQDSSAKWIFVDAKGEDRLGHLHIRRHMHVIRLDGDKEAGNWRELLSKTAKEDLEMNSSDEAVLFYTSGTTGLPKGVPLTHANIVFQLDAVEKNQIGATI